MKKKFLFIIAAFLSVYGRTQSFISENLSAQSFSLKDAVICVDPNDHELVRQAAALLQADIEKVTRVKPEMTTSITGKTAIIIGSADRSSLIKMLTEKKGLDMSSITQRWEAFLWQSNANQLIIAGSDRRGTAYGIFEFSKQIGVSPWNWWADVPIKNRESLYLKKNMSFNDAPKVKYRGIFINDEAPALSNWSKEKFGGFNHLFYEKVFELILRLKGNYIWPAMWGNAFYDDDSLNIKMADKYGIVIGTSHHEPLMRAHDEWRRYGSGKWNYDSNEVKLKEFWRAGMQRATNEKIVSVGMRGDGDEPMSRQTATTLLEKIVSDQRKIITEVTGKPADQTPQLWALYKEVQDYYDQGMRVPDDVTLLLADDNWGNIRKLPRLNEKPRTGGYGIYYHFDYVGGPRNYKWLNTNPLPRIWEQMHLAWEYNARQIWIVNVGDIKPMEFPTSFFLDYAWDPEKTGPADLQAYTEKWAADQFGKQHAKEIGDILAKYGKYNGRRKPELLDANTYSLATGEWKEVATAYSDLLKRAEAVGNALPTEYKDAYFQLVLHPVKACANLYGLYYNAALNKQAYAKKWKQANGYADQVKQLYTNDSLITLEYHQLNNGKWNHLMDQTHIGYTYWQQPNSQKMPEVKYVPADSIQPMKEEAIINVKKAAIPAGTPTHSFYQEEKKGISIEADHFTKAINTNGIKWQVLPDHGRTGSAITPFPVTATEQKPGGNSPHVEYEIYTYGEGDFYINTYHSPTLNLHSAPEGLQYAISVDDEMPQIISINKEDKTSSSGIWNKWAAENMIIQSTKHHISKPGKHTVKYWMVNPTLVLQKLVLDFGKTTPSYLGPTETIHQAGKK
ncbi:MAG: glycosyl hydrolase 115 family protein [Sphingobacteriales bacterium]|nr:glycosyl hydrolase 115 family protein [Sphingobacteriales bacterium]OJW00186.1 MAG: glycosyhydrolase [Sphingobacteriales bacterium 44-61]